MNNVSYVQKDITTIDCGLIAHGCNVKRKFRSGVAGAIRSTWPQVYKDYMDRCDETRFGSFDVVELSTTLVVANCYTQRMYGYDSTIQYASPDAIYSSLNQLAQWARDDDRFDTIHIPRIGCGLGGLMWDSDVLPVLHKIDIEFVVCDFAP